MEISIFLLKEATIIIVGSWNAAILQPKWIAKEILHLPHAENFDVQYAIGATTTFRAEIKGLYFFPTNERLIINPTSEEDNLFKLADHAASEIIAKLPYTPIDAIGYNFAYELTDNETFSIDVGFDVKSYEAIYKTIKGSPTQRSLVQHSVAINDDKNVTLNISFLIAEKQRMLKLNYHYQVNDNKELISQAVKKFYHYYSHSRLVNDKLIK